MSTDTPNPHDSPRQQLQALLSRIEQLALSDQPAQRFYETFLNEIANGLGAEAGLVLLAGPANSRTDAASAGSTADFRLASRFESDAAGADSRVWLDRLRQSKEHNQTLERVLGKAVPESLEPGPANPTDRLLLIAPLTDPGSGEVFGIVELLRPTGLDQAATANYLRLMDRLGHQAAVFRRLSGAGAEDNRSRELSQFVHAVHASLDQRQTAYTIVNEGRRLTSCERLSLAVWDGRCCELVAVSGQDWFDRRSRSVMTLEQLAGQVAESGQPLWYRTGSPEHATAACLDCAAATKSREIVVVPVAGQEATDPSQNPVRPDSTFAPHVFAVLMVAEQFTSDAPGDLDVQLQTLGRLAAPALANAIEHESLPLRSTIQRLGRLQRGVRTSKGRTILWLLAGIALALLIIPSGLDMEARGELLPVDRANVFAKTDGIIEDVHVSHGTSVEEGQLLVSMRDADVDSQLIRLDGEQHATAARLRVVRATLLGNQQLPYGQRDQFAAEQGQLERTLSGLQTRLVIHQQTVESLEVRSPRNGLVQTWDVRKLLIDRPVGRGQKLMTVADPSGPWELEIRMPGHRMGHIQQAQRSHGDDLPVEFVLASEPGRRFHGRIRRTHDRAEVHDETGHTVLISVDVDRADVSALKPGTEVVARVECGWRPIGYVWFHELYEFVQKQVLFRL